MQLTIIAYANSPGERVDRLAWGLGTRRPCEKFELLVVDLTPDGDPGLAERLKPYAAAFPSRVVRATSVEDPLVHELVRGEVVMTAPASAVPIGDATRELYEQGRERPACANPVMAGPMAVYTMDDLGTNLTAWHYEKDFVNVLHPGVMVLCGRTDHPDYVRPTTAKFIICGPQPKPYWHRQREAN
jgi:hypothetical protein